MYSLTLEEWYFICNIVVPISSVVLGIIGFWFVNKQLKEQKAQRELQMEETELLTIQIDSQNKLGLYDKRVESYINIYRLLLNYESARDKLVELDSKTPNIIIDAKSSVNYLKLINNILDSKLEFVDVSNSTEKFKDIHKDVELYLHKLDLNAEFLWKKETYKTLREFIILYIGLVSNLYKVRGLKESNKKDWWNLEHFLKLLKNLKAYTEGTEVGTKCYIEESSKCVANTKEDISCVTVEGRYSTNVISKCIEEIEKYTTGAVYTKEEILDCLDKLIDTIDKCMLETLSYTEEYKELLKSIAKIEDKYKKVKILIDKDVLQDEIRI